MKKFINLFFIFALVAVGFTSCDEKEEVPGGIPGMGNTPGKLEIKEPFVVPEGISFNIQSEDEITFDNLFSTKAQLKSTNSIGGVIGCGGSNLGNVFTFWIRIKVMIQNRSNIDQCFTIPTGTVFWVSDQAYQNGITITPIEICVKKNSQWNYSVMLMCLNKGDNGSGTNVTYEAKGVTSSSAMWKLLNILNNKICDIKYYSNYNSPSANLKSANALDLEKYKEIADHIQNAVWAITNGDGLSEEQIDYLENIPDLDE
jgi:hypothetical protein